MSAAAVLLIDPHFAGVRGDLGQRFALLAQIRAEPSTASIASQPAATLS
jgi:hypothetical protein